MSQDLTIAAAQRCRDGEHSEADYARMLALALDIAESDAGDDWDGRHYQPPKSPEAAGSVVLAWISKLEAQGAGPSLAISAPPPAEATLKEESRLCRGVSESFHPEQLKHFLSNLFSIIGPEKEKQIGSHSFEYTVGSLKHDWLSLYVLQLEDECWYVGITTRPEDREQQQKTGQSPVVGDNRGACWTGIHRYISKVFEGNLGMCSWETAKGAENRMTTALMQTFGWRRVRGGDYCRCSESATWNDLMRLVPEASSKLKSQSVEFRPSNYRTKATRCGEASCDVLNMNSSQNGK